MPPKKQKIRPYGNPKPANANQISNPKTEEEKVQALADYFESKIKAKILQQMMERGLMISDIKYALGTDGENLEVYDKKLETNFQGVATKSKNPQSINKDQAPELKKVSTEKAVEIEIPGVKKDKKSKNSQKK